MNLFGYSSEEKETLMKLSEASIECSIDEIELMIEFLNKQKQELIMRAQTLDKDISIHSDDYTEWQCPLNREESALFFLVNLKSVVDKYKTKL